MTHVVCDLCGANVVARALTQHQKGKTCRGQLFYRRMKSKGWRPGTDGLDVRKWGIPGEHGPMLRTPSQKRSSVGYVVYHPRWAFDVADVMRETGRNPMGASGFTARIWRRVRDDAEWRDALLAAWAVGGVEGAGALLREVELGIVDDMQNAIRSIKNPMRRP